MPKKILVIMGHPAVSRKSFCEALAEAYCDAARKAGHAVEYIKLSDLKFDPLLHDGYTGHQPFEPDIRDAREKLRHTDHIVFIYPLWLMMIPALLKGFLERTFTNDFAFQPKAKNPLGAGLLRGKTARLVQTMGMPTFIYRLYFHAPGAKALKALLSFCGIVPVAITYCGAIDDAHDARRNNYLRQMETLGTAGK